MSASQHKQGSGSQPATAGASNIQISGTKYAIPSRYIEGCREISWKALGETMIKKVIDEVQGVSKVDFRFGEKQPGTKASPVASHQSSPSSWEFVHEKHDVMVFRKKMQDSRLSFIGRGIIDKPLREVAEFIKDVQNNMSWDHFLIEARYIKTVSETPTDAAYVGYQRYETKKCMLTTKRDLLYLASCSYRDNRYIQAGLSLENPDYPCPPGLKRVEAAMGSGWLMDKVDGSEERTLVTYLGNLDLKGIPIFVMNMILKRHPLAVHYVRRQMIDPARSRSDSVTSASASDDGGAEGFDDSHIFRSMELPEDFVPYSDGSNRNYSSSYEESMPIDHFTKLD